MSLLRNRGSDGDTGDSTGTDHLLIECCCCHFVQKLLLKFLLPLLFHLL